MEDLMQAVPMGILYEKTHAWLRTKAQEAGSIASLCSLAKAHNPTMYKVLSQDKNTNARAYLTWLENLGAKITFPDEQADLTRNVCWVDAKIVSAGEGQKKPIAEDYWAVPLVGEAGAGPGIMPSEEIKSWVLVHRHQHAVRFKRNLLAVEIEKNSTSMTPLLRPGDVVLVDRDDFKPNKAGGIFLVREPGPSGGGMVKRVATRQQNGDMAITFYSDNAPENPPQSYSLREDYDGEISNAIVGRCVWSWSDLMGK